MYKHAKLAKQLLGCQNVNYFNEIRRRTSFAPNETINNRFVHLIAVRRCKNSNQPITSSVKRTSIGMNGNIEAKSHDNRSDKSVDCMHPHFEETIDEINRNYRVMICLRGAPGSGKSYLARTIIDRTVNEGNYSEHIFSSDDFFYDQQTKQYHYDRSRLRVAHNVNKFRVARRARSGWSPIIVDNTNMKLWEMFAYVREGIRNGYVIKILEPRTTWSQSVDELTMRNKHNVDRETIQRMLSMYEPGNVSDVLNALNLLPTQPTLRNFPRIREADCEE